MQKWKFILIPSSVLVCAAAASSFTRFIPQIKARYDYGVLIFILTFSLVSVSGYRIDQLLQLAHQRLSTILIGGATCIIISLCVFPVWAGEDLHKLITSNLDKLANYLEGIYINIHQLLNLPTFLFPFGDSFLFFREVANKKTFNSRFWRWIFSWLWQFWRKCYGLQ